MQSLNPYISNKLKHLKTDIKYIYALHPDVFIQAFWRFPFIFIDVPPHTHTQLSMLSKSNPHMSQVKISRLELDGIVIFSTKELTSQPGRRLRLQANQNPGLTSCEAP